MDEEERKKYKLKLSKMKVSELRALFRNQQEMDLDQIGYVLTEFKRRIPYCEFCGEKAPMHISTTIQCNDGSTYQRKVCPRCYKFYNEWDSEYEYINDGDES